MILSQQDTSSSSISLPYLRGVLGGGARLGKPPMQNLPQWMRPLRIHRRFEVLPDFAARTPRESGLYSFLPLRIHQGFERKVLRPAAILFGRVAFRRPKFASPRNLYEFGKVAEALQFRSV